MNYKQVHFVGIGGIGMSALAQFLDKIGMIVSGSDRSESEMTLYLKEKGINIQIGHESRNCEFDLLIRSEAIAEDNVEVILAREKNIKVMTYFEALGQFTKDYNVLAICGTHGKTTTTAMLSKVLIESGVDPSVIVGSRFKDFNFSNFRFGESNNFLVEACEYRASFLHLFPRIILINNIELDHMDFYKSEDQYFQVYLDFVKKLPDDGVLIINLDDDNCLKLVDIVKREFKKIEIRTFSSKLQKIDNLNLKVFGEHNISNAVAAYIFALALGVNEQDAIKSLNEFEGTWRRFEFKGEKGGIVIYDDYAHHPTEIRASLKGARSNFVEKRIVTVFQPHQYSRTINLWDEFVKSFDDTDVLVIPNIYEVRDEKKDIEMFSMNKFLRDLEQNGVNVVFGNGFDGTLDYLKNNLKQDDVLITMGAGDVYKIGESFLA